MPYTPTQVQNLVWGSGGPKNAKLAAIGIAWANTIHRNLTTIFGVFAPGMVVNAQTVTLVERSIRTASDYLKRQAPTLYVSDMYLRHRHNPPPLPPLALDERGECFEHVVPIKFSLPEKLFLNDPIGATDAPSGVPLQWLNRIGRAILTPVCNVSQHENIRIDRLSHPNWALPFLRYCEVNDPRIIRDSPLQPIEVYDTVTGTLLNKRTFTWDDHFKLMTLSPVFDQGLNCVINYFGNFAIKNPALVALLAGRPGNGSWPVSAVSVPRSGYYNAADRLRLRTLMRNLALHGPVVSKQQVFEVPVGRDRLTLTVRHPLHLDECVIRINIGPDYGRREIYFNAKKMHVDGRVWIDRIAADVNSRGLPIQLHPQTQNSSLRRAYNIRWTPAAGNHITAMITALNTVVATMTRLYPPP